MTPDRVANPLDDTTRMAPAPEVPVQPEGQAPAACLVVLSGSSVGEMYRLEKDQIVLGRGEKVDLRLIDDGISREHAQILRQGGQLFLEDLGSTNGTYCNGERVTRHPLAEGDKILIGSTTILKFSYQDALEESFQRKLFDSAVKDGLAIRADSLDNPACSWNVDSAVSGRRELAAWLVRPEHPLTSRVIVNRVWLWHFGEGLVRSPDNFGSLGERPTHPELLDWLSRRFIEEGWSLKKLHRLIMLSATYQMSTATNDAASVAGRSCR